MDALDVAASSRHTLSLPPAHAKQTVVLTIAVCFCMVRVEDKATMTLLERLNAHSTTNDADCWIWCGATNEYGYGRIKVDGRNDKVHRASWSAYNAAHIKDGHDIDHRCRNRACWNPTHLREQPASVNRADGSNHRWSMRTHS